MNKYGVKRRDEYTALRKPLDEYVSGLLAEINLLEKKLKEKSPPEAVIKTQHHNKEIRKYKMALSDEKKRSLSREVVLLQEIDRLKEERDDAFFRLNICSRGTILLDT